jgi:hypothetical protein
MTRRFSFAVATCVLLLTACSPAGAVTKADLTVEEAKATVLAEGQRLVSLIPEKYVETYVQREKAHLLSCSEDLYRWPDQGRVTLKGDPKMSELLAAIADAYRGQEGFTVELTRAWDGANRVIISAEEGAHYYITPGVKADLQVDSFSACFALGEEQRAGDAY